MNSVFILLNGSGDAYNIADPNSIIMIRQLAEKLTKIGNCKVVLDLPSETEKNRYNHVTKSFSLSTSCKLLAGMFKRDQTIR